MTHLFDLFYDALIEMTCLKHKWCKINKVSWYYFLLIYVRYGVISRKTLFYSDTFYCKSFKQKLGNKLVFDILINLKENKEMWSNEGKALVDLAIERNS